MDNIYDAFLQLSLSPRQAFRVNFDTDINKRGDLGFRDSFRMTLPFLRDKDENTSIRLGFHHNFAPGSDLIGNFMYQNQTFNEKYSGILFDPTLLLYRG